MKVLTGTDLARLFILIAMEKGRDRLSYAEVSKWTERLVARLPKGPPTEGAAWRELEVVSSFLTHEDIQRFQNSVRCEPYYYNADIPMRASDIPPITEIWNGALILLDIEVPCIALLIAHPTERNSRWKEYAGKRPWIYSRVQECFQAPSSG